MVVTVNTLRCWLCMTSHAGSQMTCLLSSVTCPGLHPLLVPSTAVLLFSCCSVCLGSLRAFWNRSGDWKMFLQPCFCEALPIVPSVSLSALLACPFYLLVISISPWWSKEEVVYTSSSDIFGAVYDSCFSSRRYIFLGCGWPFDRRVLYVCCADFFQMATLASSRVCPWLSLSLYWSKWQAGL